ncbi:hypothetical protein SEA_WHITNEY_63 [Gordonia phage Whitney]|nr:hypothetical protein SEA_WHITNEY_63 [Gordonia phage Whitney]
MNIPIQYVPETDSDSRPHVLDEGCWCRPRFDSEAGVVQAIYHADNVHVLPVGDLVAHEESGLCPCGPRIESCWRDDGAVGRVIIHHSLDGREEGEP